ncbi:MAG: tetratricopeptide repeat protein, partial [Anaerolineae bacterium]
MSTVPPTVSESKMERLETAVQNARDKEQPEALITALAELGSAYLADGDAPKALTQFEEAIDLAEEMPELAARLLGMKGKALTKIGNYHFAANAYRKSRKLAETIDHQPLLIDSLVQLGLLEVETGKPMKAIKKLEQAFGMTLNNGFQSRQMYISGKLGGIFLGLDALDKAIEYFAVALHTSQELGNKLAECSYHLSIGNVFLSNKEYDVAAKHFEEALNLAGVVDDRQAEISALSNLLKLHIAIEKPRIAVLYGDSVIRLARDTQNHAVEIGNINALAAFLLEQGQFKKALPYLERGLAVAQAQQDWEWQLTMLTHLGFAHFNLEQNEAALANYESALTFARQLVDPAAEAVLHGRIGAVQAELGDYEAAAASAEQSLALAQQLDNQPLVGEQQISLA